MNRGSAVALLALGLALTAPALGAGVPLEKADKEQLKAAQRTFVAADGLYDAKRYAEAITAYRASYEIVASPNSRLMIARSLAALGKLDDAYAELVGAVADAKTAVAADAKYEPTLKAAETELASLEPRIGRVELVLGAALEGAKINVGPRTLTAAQHSTPVVVTPGNIVVVAALADGRSVRKEVAVAAGATEKVELDLAPEVAPGAQPRPPERPRPAPPPPTDSRAKQHPLRAYAFVAGGVGVAGLATFTIFGLMNKSKFDDLDSSCDNGHCGPSRQDDIDAGRRYQTLANVGLVVGVVGIGAGTTLFLLSKPKAEPSTALRLNLAPGFASVAGDFQ